MSTTTLSVLLVTGMSCGSCRQHVSRALQAVPGVSQVQVDLASGRVEILHEPAVVPETLIQTIIAAGYTARVAALPA